MSEKTITSARLFDRYEIYHKIGSGGNSVIHSARDLKTARDIALKITEIDIHKNLMQTQQTLQEGRMLYQLNHECLPQIYGQGLMKIDSKRIHYISMELIDAFNLRDLIRCGDTVNWSDLETNRFLLSAARTISYLHDEGVIHGDVQPANILCPDAKNAAKIKLIDLGLARFEDLSRGNPILHKGWVCGTPGYIAPEIVKGGLARFASDVFSLGMIAYNLYADEVNLLKTEYENTTKILLATSIVDLSNCSIEHIPLNTRELVKQMLSNRPSERPTINRVVEQLEDIVKQEKL